MKLEILPSASCRTGRRSPVFAMAVAAAMASWVLGPGWGGSRLRAAELASTASLPFEARLDVAVPMRDGVSLAANIYLPTSGGPHPVLLLRTPYGKPDTQWGDARKYTAAGYAVVVQDCRGRGKSSGVWDPFVSDPKDGLDTQSWVAQQPWCNGRIGTSGGSYGGWTQWASAPGAHSAVKCLMPVVPFADVYRDIAYLGGGFQLSLLVGWGAAVGGVPLKPEELQSVYRLLPLATLGNQLKPKVPYINDWIRHTTADDYWKQRSIGERYEDITVPILNVGGWYDIFSKTTLELTAQVRARSKDRMARRNQFVIMGPWSHGVGSQKVGEMDYGPEAKRSIGDLQFQWMEYWLKDRETGVQDWAPYQLFVMGENKWRGEHEWPLKRTEYTAYYLHSGGNANTASGDGLLTRTPPAQEPPDAYTSDPAQPVPTTGGNILVGAPVGPYDQTPVEQRKDVLVYTTAPLDAPVEVTGNVRLLLHADSDALDTDFTAKLIDVHPDGRAINLCDGLVRARFREGMDKPRLLEPGKVTAMEVDLWVTSNLFAAGHRIRLEVASSNFPRFDRNPNTGTAFGSDDVLRVAHQRVHHSAEYPSRLVLPVIPR